MKKLEQFLIDHFTDELDYAPNATIEDVLRDFVLPRLDSRFNEYVKFGWDYCGNKVVFYASDELLFENEALTWSVDSHTLELLYEDNGGVGLSEWIEIMIVYHIGKLRYLVNGGVGCE